MKRQEKIDSISVVGIPQPIARGLETVVQMIRQQLPTTKHRQRGTWPIKHGTVTGSLHRRDLYDDVA